MLNQLIHQLISIDTNNCDASDTEELLSKILAQYCLDIGEKAPYFQFEYEKQMVLQVREKYPDYPIVRLAIITGINRHRVSKILKGEAYLRYSDKVDLLLNYLTSYCQRHNTQRIKKHGAFESFQYFCTVVANGTFTAAAMADELIEQGKIVDKGHFYYLLNLGE